ncbi:MAG: dihydroneopterin aldolase [Verrucomicrobiota bacterium]
MSDEIKIKGLRVVSTIGVPDEERSRPQSLAVNVSIRPGRSFDELNDDLAGTVDYFAVSEAIRDAAATGERRLIETLASDLVDVVLDFEQVAWVRVEVEKYILADCDAVSVATERAQPRA